MRNKALNAFYYREIEQAKARVKTDHEYHMADIKKTLRGDMDNVARRLLQAYETVVAGGRAPKELREQLEEIRPKLVVLNFASQVDSHVDRWDKDHHPRPLKLRKQKAGINQLTLFDPAAHLVLDQDVRVNMAEAERPQVVRARGWHQTEYDKQIRNLEDAKQEGLMYYDSRLEVWLPMFTTFLDLETRVFDWKPPRANEGEAEGEDNENSD